MALFKKKLKKEQDVSPIGVIDPALDKFFAWVERTPLAKLKTVSISVVVVFLVVSVASALLRSQFPIVEDLSPVIGVPLGVALFFLGLGGFHIWNLSKSAKDPGFLSLRLKNSPAQRRRMAIIWGVIILIISLSTLGLLPRVTGGAIAVFAILSLYNFTRRTPEEIARDIAGEPDPRDAEDEDDEDEDDDTESQENTIEEETQEYIALVNSLPEAQRKILLNPKLNGALAVVEEDDIKSKKKRKLFGK